MSTPNSINSDIEKLFQYIGSVGRSIDPELTRLISYYYDQAEKLLKHQYQRLADIKKQNIEEHRGDDLPTHFLKEIVRHLNLED